MFPKYLNIPGRNSEPLTYPHFESIDDLSNWYYPPQSRALNENDTNEFGTLNPDVYVKYGKCVWLAINSRPDILSVFPKRPVTYSLTHKPRIHHLVCETPELEELRKQFSAGNMAVDLERLRQSIAERFINDMTLQICQDIQGNIRTGNRLACSDSQSMEITDHIVSPRSEEYPSDGSGSHWYNTCQYPVTGKDVSTAFDCCVISATGKTIDSGNARLTQGVISKTLACIEKANGRRPTVILTNPEVVAQARNLSEQNAGGMIGKCMVQFSTNGIELAHGNTTGLRVPSIYGIPLIASRWLNGDDTDAEEIGRMYFLDTRRDDTGKPGIELAVRVPPLYCETAWMKAPGGPLTLGKFADKAEFYSEMEIVANRSVGMGQIRDIGA